jgi:transposase-like protein
VDEPWTTARANPPGARNTKPKVKYTTKMKNRLIQRMVGPNPMSGAALARETGVSQATLSRWKQHAGRVGSVNAKDRPHSTSSRKSTKQWTAEEKLAVVMEAAGVPPEELGAFVRRKGLHLEQLERWRATVTEGAQQALEEKVGRRKQAKRGPTPEQKRILELERQLRRKEKALAEAAALLVLKKKYESLFADEEDDTNPRSEE